MDEVNWVMNTSDEFSEADAASTPQFAITSKQLIYSARGLKGVPWKHQGRSVFGVDCIGLVALSFEKAGVDLPSLLGLQDSRNYGRNAHPEMLRLVRETCESISTPIDGCLIVMKFPGEEYPRHFGIYAQGNVIHADSRSRCVVEHGYRGIWKRCEHSLWKIPGVSYV